jgi:ADP-ribose pyrophosphatase YjhB (NUDIX family)
MSKPSSRPKHPAPPKHIETIARAVIVRDRRYALICWSVPGHYGYLPGGHVEPGESVAAALRRELVEEADLSITIGRLAAVHENAFATRNKRHHELNLVYLARLGRSGGRQESVGSMEPDIAFRWVDRAELKAADIRPDGAKLWLLKNWRALVGGTWPRARVDVLSTLE